MRHLSLTLKCQMYRNMLLNCPPSLLPSLIVLSLTHSPHSFQSNSSSSSLFSTHAVHKTSSRSRTPTVSCLLSVTHQWRLPFSSSHFSSLRADTEVFGNACSLYSRQSSSGLRFPQKNFSSVLFINLKLSLHPLLLHSIHFTSLSTHIVTWHNNHFLAWKHIWSYSLVTSPCGPTLCDSVQTLLNVPVVFLSKHIHCNSPAMPAQVASWKVQM